MSSVKICGKEYPFRMTMGALMRFKRETGHDVSRMDATDLTENLVLIWCCILSACVVDNVVFEYSAQELADRLEPQDVAKLVEALSAGTDEKKTTDEATSPVTSSS
jgi:hypothetical protein